MKKVAIVIAFFCVVFGQTAYTQIDEIGLHLGGATYFGDLTPRTSIFSTGIESYSAGLSSSLRLSDALSLRGMISYMRFSGDDAFQKDENRRLRNLSFRNQILEGSLMLDFNVTDFYSDYYRRLQFHVLAGVSVYRHNPQAEIDGRWVDLQPLGTEGQVPEDSLALVRFPYNLVQAAIPLGLRVEYELKNNISISLEYIHRIAFTDYLDDVSTRYPDLESLDPLARRLSFRTVELDGQEDAVPVGIRGNSEKNDAFASFQISIVYRLLDSKTLQFGRGHR